LGIAADFGCYCGGDYFHCLQKAKEMNFKLGHYLPAGGCHSMARTVSHPAGQNIPADRRAADQKFFIPLVAFCAKNFIVRST